MSSHIPVWDSTHLEYDDDDITFDNPYVPWKNVTKLTKTVTTSIKGIQETLHKEKKDKKHLLKEEDIAAALTERNLLRLTHTIQISSNKQFLAITFQNTQIMETFCTEPQLVRGFNITFRPKKDFPKKKKTLLNISFLNIPGETPNIYPNSPTSLEPSYIFEKTTTEFQITTGTRVYQVNRLYQHLPRHINDMFGRTVLYIYDNQPTDQPREKNNTNRSYCPRQRTTNRYSTTNEENTNSDNQPDSESKNQQEQQQQEPNTKPQMKHSSKTKPKTENKNNNRKTLQLEKLKHQHNTILTKNHHRKPLTTTQKFRKQHQLKKKTNATRPHHKNKHNLN